MQWFKYFILNNTLTINLEELFLGCQTSDSLPNRLSLLSVISHCILLDVAFTSKTHKPLTDQGLKETQTKSSQEDKSTPSIIETTGNNVKYFIIFSYSLTIRVKR